MSLHHSVAAAVPTTSGGSSSVWHPQQGLRAAWLVRRRSALYVVVDVQEFGWAEEDLPKRKADRGSSLKADMAAELAKEPMFCFEARLPNPCRFQSQFLTAAFIICATPSPMRLMGISYEQPLMSRLSRACAKCHQAYVVFVQTSLKMLYWSMLMYDYEEVRVFCCVLSLGRPSALASFAFHSQSRVHIAGCHVLGIKCHQYHTHFAAFLDSGSGFRVPPGDGNGPV